MTGWKMKSCLPWRTEEAMDEDLETVDERKQRYNSLYIIDFTMFLMSLSFSIVLTGMYPYLEKLDRFADKEFMGYVVAANPFAQMLFSPIFGWWANRRGSIRLPMLMTLALFIVSSAVYSVAEVFTGQHRLVLIGSRFFVGVSSANVAVVRSYVSAATKLKERTNAVTMIALMQVLGFVVGPALQAAVTPLGDNTRNFLGVLPLNMYTAAGWINVLLGIFNFVCFLPCCFTERKIATKEAMRDQGKTSEKETWKSMKTDYLAAWSLICAFFVLVFNFVLLETIGTSLTMDQFAWGREDSVFYMGLLMSIGAVISCLVFAAIGPLSKRIDERRVMLWVGFFCMIIGRIVHIPWGTEPPLVAEFGPYGNETIDPLTNNTKLGCPSTQEWCRYTPHMTIPQFVIGYGFTAIGYPVSVSLVQSIFTKVLGTRPQGVWMGMLTGAGCASRVFGPVFVGLIYTRYGIYHTFGVTGFTLIVTMIWLSIVYKRLIPQYGDETTTRLKFITEEDDGKSAVELTLLRVNKTNDEVEKERAPDS